MRTETIVERIASSELPIRDVGVFQAHCFRSVFDSAEHLVLTYNISPIESGEKEATASSHSEPALVRVQTEDRLGDLFLGSEFYTHERNIRALKAIVNHGSGVFAYIRHPRQGLLTKAVKAMSSAESGSTQAMSLREYGLGSQLLRAFSANQIRLLTNSEKLSPLLEAFDIEVVEKVGF